MLLHELTTSLSSIRHHLPAGLSATCTGPARWRFRLHRQVHHAPPPRTSCSVIDHLQPASASKRAAFASAFSSLSLVIIVFIFCCLAFCQTFCNSCSNIINNDSN